MSNDFRFNVEDREKVKNALVGFVVRVASERHDERSIEVEVLPSVVETLLKFQTFEKHETSCGKIPCSDEKEITAADRGQLLAVLEGARHALVLSNGVYVTDRPEMFSEVDIRYVIDNKKEIELLDFQINKLGGSDIQPS